MSSQLDLFEPIHVSLLNESEYFSEKAKPLLIKAKELKELAFSHCPHDKIEYEKIFHEDEYGSSHPDWTEIKVTCSFCGKYKIMNYDKFCRNNKTIEGWFHEDV